nr:ATP-binding cassette domain-containing protein [Maliibacterium massiliense]
MFEMIRMSHIRCEAGDTPPVAMGNLTLFQGRATGLIGLYDSGHASMVDILVGRAQKSGGSIRYMDMPVDIPDEQAARKLGIHYIGGETKVARNLTVAENLFLHTPDGYVAGGVFSLKRIARRAAPFLQAAGLQIDPMTSASVLSVAQQHLLQLARILAVGNKIVVLDNAAVDYSEREIAQLKNIILALKRQGLCFLIKFNSITSLMDITDNLHVMRNGATVKILNRVQYDYDDIFLYMTGHAAWHSAPPEEPAALGSRPVVLEVRGLCAKDAHDTLSDISFCVRAGETVAFVDQSGSSGNLLARILSGAKSGALQHATFVIDGAQRSIASISDAMACGILMLPERGAHSGLFYNMSIKDNLTINILDKVSRFGFIRKRFGNHIYEDFKRELREETQIELKHNSLSELSEIGCYALHLYKSMLIKLRVLIVINPKAYNDEQTAEYIYRKIEKMKRQQITVLLFTNNPQDARRHADRSFVLVDGRMQ